MDASFCRVLGSARNSLVGDMPVYDTRKPNQQGNIFRPTRCVCFISVLALDMDGVLPMAFLERHTNLAAARRLLAFCRQHVSIRSATPSEAQNFREDMGPERVARCAASQAHGLCKSGSNDLINFTKDRCPDLDAQLTQ